MNIDRLYFYNKEQMYAKKRMPVVYKFIKIFQKYNIIVYSRLSKTME